MTGAKTVPRLVKRLKKCTVILYPERHATLKNPYARTCCPTVLLLKRLEKGQKRLYNDKG
jgi:hypothetical protein